LTSGTLRRGLVGNRAARCVLKCDLNSLYNFKLSQYLSIWVIAWVVANQLIVMSGGADVTNKLLLGGKMTEGTFDEIPVM
jgi:hypothetical protein